MITGEYEKGGNIRKGKPLLRAHQVLIGVVGHSLFILILPRSGASYPWENLSLYHVRRLKYEIKRDVSRRKTTHGIAVQIVDEKTIALPHEPVIEKF